MDRFGKVLIGLKLGGLKSLFSQGLSSIGLSHGVTELPQLFATLSNFRCGFPQPNKATQNNRDRLRSSADAKVLRFSFSSA